MDTAFGYSFPAIRGVQAGKEYYVSMCPMRLIPKIFLFNEEELIPELRAQRILNKARIPEMTRYVTENPESYIFSAITASLDGVVKFDPISTALDESKIGVLHIQMDARFIINDGQHRRAAIEAAIREKPQLADESIAVVFFVDTGLERSQQMFADLNRYAIRPSRSLSVLYDHRDDGARLTKIVVAQSPIFSGLVEMEKSSLSMRSSKLFTLSAVYTANSALLSDIHDRSFEDMCALASEFWEALAMNIPEWEMVVNGTITSSEVRQNFIHSHGIALQAFGRIGRAIISRPNAKFKSSLKVIKSMNWRKDNLEELEGRAMIGGRVSKSSNNVTLLTNLIKIKMGLALSPDEQRIEDAKARGDL
jgi:DNA sulfur modification protein DndB